jgi:hypothetical protein
MKSILTAALLTLAITTVLVAQRSAPAGRASGAAPRQAPASAALPPILMTCPHHPDVLETKPGTCPVCKLPLVPVRLDSAWMCPVHTTVTESTAGTCRMCGRQLVPVTVSLTWTCPTDRRAPSPRGSSTNPDVQTTEYLEPGSCADGSPRVLHRALRAHGNHNPQHGGQFFMAPDNWHHLEGVYPSARVFRLYLYDDYARPLPAATVNLVQARVVTKEAVDRATRRTKEIAAFPLKPVPNRPYLEARIDPLPLPAEMSAKVRFGREQTEYRFDFTFTALSKEPAAPLAPPAAAKAASPAGARASRPAATPAASAAAPALDPLTPVPIPATAKEMLAQLDVRGQQVGALIARGDFSSVWVPAFQARDLAIALEPHVTRLSSGRRSAAEPALTRVVRTAWLLDAAGDVGNRTQIEAVHAAFKAAVADVLATFAELR